MKDALLDGHAGRSLGWSHKPLGCWVRVRQSIVQTKFHEMIGPQALHHSQCVFCCWYFKGRLLGLATMARVRCYAKCGGNCQEERTAWLRHHRKDRSKIKRKKKTGASSGLFGKHRADSEGPMKLTASFRRPRSPLQCSQPGSQAMGHALGVKGCGPTVELNCSISVRFLTSTIYTST